MFNPLDEIVYRACFLPTGVAMAKLPAEGTCPSFEKTEKVMRM